MLTPFHVHFFLELKFNCIGTNSNSQTSLLSTASVISYFVMAAEALFQKSLQDLIKGIRQQKKDSSSFLSNSILEIKNELKSSDPYIKAEAVRKTTYLQMIGFNVSWASFGIVEVMSQQRFAHKRIGYLAANQSFDDTTDVLLLTTNLFKKEFNNTSSMMNVSQYEIGMAINCLANICDKNLARDCMADMVQLMSHTRPYIRKKAVLAMYKLYVKFPQGLRLTFDKLKDRLEDSESSVVSTAVNVICELANKNPRNYLALAPRFFRLLTSSSNNWMLIKVVKLLGSLVSEEPRLARKLLEPLATIIQNSSAKSLQYECIYTLTEALPHSKRDDGSDAKNAPAVIKLCSDYLRGFIEDNDQNLKYLGLVGLVHLMKSSPRSVVDHRDLVLKCLNDDDITIKTKSLELLVGIVSRRSLIDLVNHLLDHARRAEGAYRDEIIAKILFMCRQDKYSLINDFAWYTSTLLELAYMRGTTHGGEVAAQLMEISLRVSSVRPFAVESMLGMLLSDRAILGQARSTVCEVMRAAAWILGEYSEIISAIVNDTAPDRSPDEEEDEDQADDEREYWIQGATGNERRSRWRGQPLHVMILNVLINPRATNLPVNVQTVYVQAAMKIFVCACNDCPETALSEIITILRTKLGVYLQSQNLEVQERASTFRHLLSEFNILPMNWEESMELAEKRQQESALEAKNAGIIDLLEFPEYSHSSVQALDDAGARACKNKSTILNTLVVEKFYSVHSKAQRRVPIPDDLNIDAPLNESALNKLLAIDIPDDLTVTSLRFVAVDDRIIPNPGHAIRSEEDKKMSQILSGTFSKSNKNKDQNSDEAVYGSNAPGGGEDRDGSISVQSHQHGNSNSASSSRHRDRDPNDDIFMLPSGNNRSSGVEPLSKILGDNFEDDAAAGGGKRSSRKSKHAAKEKGSKRASKSAAIDHTDMLPAGASLVDDDDDNNNNGKGKGSKRSVGAGAGKQSNKNTTGNDLEDMDHLESVDITTPLREDERLTVPTHRVVADRERREETFDSTNSVENGDRHRKHKSSSSSKDKKEKKSKRSSSKNKNGGDDSSDEDNNISAEADDKLSDMLAGGGSGKKHKSSSSGSSSSSSSRKSKSKNSSSEAAAVEADLLGEDVVAASSSSVRGGGGGGDNLLGLEWNAATSTAAAGNYAGGGAGDNDIKAKKKSSSKESSKKKSSSSSSSSSSSKMWITCFESSAVSVLYATASTAEDVSLHFKVLSNLKDEATLSVTLTSIDGGEYLQPTNSGSIHLAKSLVSGGDCKASVPLALRGVTQVSKHAASGNWPKTASPLRITCSFDVAVETLLGAETTSNNVELFVTVCSTLASYKISEGDFAEALSKSSPRWSTMSTSLPVTISVSTSANSVAKAAYKALGSFVHGHKVESESSKAVSLACQSLDGSGVYFLGKMSSNGQQLSVDVKCLCASKEESDVLCTQISQALQLLPL